jgi:hypothetical protein
MKGLSFIILLFILFSATISISAQEDISYFKSLNVEVSENHGIDKVFCDPNHENIIYYISYDKLYRTNDGVSSVLIDLGELSEEVDQESDEFKTAKEELYKTIYNEEKENIEDEYQIDDAEEYYSDLIETNTDNRFEDEVEMLKDKFRYKRADLSSNEKSFAPIKSLTFLQDLSTHIIVDTVDSFFISINSGNSFFTQDKADISSIKISDASLSKREILFTSNNKLYLFDAKENIISRIDISDYKNEIILATTSYYPYIVILTDKNVHLLKQEKDKLIRVTKKEFTPKNTEKYKLYYFSGKYIFITTKNSIMTYDIYSNTIKRTNFKYYEINTITLKEDILYIGTDLGFLSYNIYNKELQNISLGLLPEKVKSLSVSVNKNIFVTNNYSIYVLKQFKNIADLLKDKNLFALMRKVQLTYPPLESIIQEAFKYNSITRSKITSMYSRNKKAPYLPILKLKYVKPMQNLVEPSLDNNNLIINAQYSSNPYFEAFLYFDLSSWIFDVKDMRVNRLNSEMNEFREKLSTEITNYYNTRQVLEVLYILTTNLSEKLTFKIQILEQGVMINSISGKKFF